MVEAGNTYETLRGVSLEGRGIIVEDPELIWRGGGSTCGSATPAPTPMSSGRSWRPCCANGWRCASTWERVRTWDHRKLGMSPTELGGTTGPHIDGPGLAGPG